MYRSKKITNPIFIIGSSRSGTCLLGEMLKKHNHVHCLIEYPSIFRYATQLATQPQLKKQSQQVEAKIATLYHKAWLTNYGKCYSCSSACKKVNKNKKGGFFPCYDIKSIKRYADKSHSHLMNVDVLLQVFPQAQFLHIYRDARGVVSSMLEHKSLVNRFTSKAKINSASHWPQYWYGIESLEEYQKWQSWDIESKMAYAWRSRLLIAKKHAQKISAEQWLDIRYEDLVENAPQQTAIIFDFLHLAHDNNISKHISSTSKDKWKKKLNVIQIEKILEITRALLVEYGYKIES